MGNHQTPEFLAFLSVNHNNVPATVRPMTVHAVIDNRTGLLWYIGVGRTPEQACTVAASMASGSRDAQYCRARFLQRHEAGFIVYDASAMALARDLAISTTAVMQLVRRTYRRITGEHRHRLEVNCVTAMPLVGLFARFATPT